MLRSLMAVSIAGLVCITAGGACGQGSPAKPVRIVTGAAGGGSDFMSRLIAEGISGPLGQPVIVDNRWGGIISGEAVAKSRPDGYTLMVNGSTLWVFPLLNA